MNNKKPISPEAIHILKTIKKHQHLAFAVPLLFVILAVVTDLTVPPIFETRVLVQYGICLQGGPNTPLTSNCIESPDVTATRWTEQYGLNKPQPEADATSYLHSVRSKDRLLLFSTRASKHTDAEALAKSLSSELLAVQNTLIERLREERQNSIQRLDQLIGTITTAERTIGQVSQADSNQLLLRRLLTLELTEKLKIERASMSALSSPANLSSTEILQLVTQDISVALAPKVAIFLLTGLLLMLPVTLSYDYLQRVWSQFRAS